MSMSILHVRQGIRITSNGSQSDACNRGLIERVCVAVALSAVLVLSMAVRPALSSICTWDGTTGNWSDTARWSCASVPGAADDVFISSGTVTLDGDATIASLSITGGTLMGSHTLIVNGALTWSNATIWLDDGGPGTDLTINGNSTWNLGSRTLGKHTRLELNDKTTWTFGYVIGDTSAVVVNNDTLLQQTGFQFLLSGSASPRPVFDNEGVFQYDNAGAVSEDWIFDNHNDVEILQGTVTLTAGGTASSQFTVADGATLSFGTGSFDLGPADFTTIGTGLLIFASPTTTDTLSGTINNGGTLRVSGSNITFTQSSIGGTFGVTGGTAAFNQNTSVPELIWTGGIIKTVTSTALSVNGPTTFPNGDKRLAAHSRLELNGKTTWTVGHMIGDTSAVLVNNDTLLQQTGFQFLLSGSASPRPVFDNEGVFQYDHSGAVSQGWIFDNHNEVDVLQGTMTLTAGGTASSQFTVADGATLSFGTGSFDLGPADFTTVGTGLVNFAAAATADTLLGTINNGGTLRVSGSNITFTQSNIGGTFGVTGGTAAFNQNTSVQDLIWTGGIIKTVTSTALSVNGPTTFNTGDRRLAAHSRLELNDKTTWTFGSMIGDTSAVLVNNDTLLQQTGFQFLLSGSASPRPVFDNEGVFQYDHSGAVSQGWIFDNHNEADVLQGTMGLTAGGTNTGQIGIESAATFLIGSDAFTNAVAGTIRGNGTVSFSGSGPNYTNEGTFAPGFSPGILTVNGNYANSKLEIEIDDGTGPGIGNDLLSVTGNAPLTDTVSVILDSGFSPTLGQQFKIIACGGTCSGGFSKILVNKANVVFSEIVNADTVSLEVADLGASLHVRALLEGPYLGGSMSTTLEDDADVPLSQPFSDPMFDATVLDFDSVQTVASLPDSTVDWVLVSLRTGTTAATEVPGTKFAAIISAGGTVANAGDDSLRFNVADGSYYLVLRARNHLDVMSSSAVTIVGGAGSWDFTTASTQAFGTAPMKDLGGGHWGLYAADGNVDGQDTALDFTLWLTETTAGATGYEPGDFNMDAQVTVLDFTEWLANTTAGATSGVPN